MTMDERPASHLSAPTTDWWTLRAYYHQPDKDQLMVRGAAPVLRRLQAEGRVRQFFLQRHWHHGPHLRVHLRPHPDAEPGTLRGEVGAALEAFFRTSPSRTELSVESYTAKYAAVAGYELLDQPLLPLHGNHELHWSPLLMRDHFYGSAGIADLSRDLLSELQPLVTRLLAQSPSLAERMLQFAGWMFAFSGAFQGCLEEMFGSVPSVALSFRSHAEGYYHNVPGGEEVRQRFERSARENGPALREVLHQALQERDGPYAFLRDALAQAAQRAMALHARGELHVFGREDYETAERRLAPGLPAARGSYGPRHAPLADPDSALSRLLQEPEIQVRRWLVNLLYDRLMTAGCRPVERFALCELVASTVESLHGPDSFLYPEPRALAGRAS